MFIIKKANVCNLLASPTACARGIYYKLPYTTPTFLHCHEKNTTVHTQATSSSSTYPMLRTLFLSAITPATPTSSTSMLHDLTDQLPVPNHALHLLRQRPLDIIILVRSPRHDDIDPRAKTREDLCAQTLPAEIDCRAIDLVEHDGR